MLVVVVPGFGEVEPGFVVFFVAREFFAQAVGSRGITAAVRRAL